MHSTSLWNHGNIIIVINSAQEKLLQSEKGIIHLNTVGPKANRGDCSCFSSTRDKWITRRLYFWLSFSFSTQPAFQTMDGEITLSPSLLGECIPAKTFRDNRQPVTSLCFDATGELCVTSAQDESLHIYNCREGKYVPDLNSHATIHISTSFSLHLQAPEYFTQQKVWRQSSTIHPPKDHGYICLHQRRRWDHNSYKDWCNLLLTTMSIL